MLPILGMPNQQKCSNRVFYIILLRLREFLLCYGSVGVMVSMLRMGTHQHTSNKTTEKWKYVNIKTKLPMNSLP